MWNGLESAVTVAQVVGLDVGGFISMIGQAARTARQNTKDCEHLARRVGLLAELVPLLQDPEARRALPGLDDTLLEAHSLVMSCQRKGLTSQLFSASRLSDRFRVVDRKIDTYLSIIPVISYIGKARRLDENPSSCSQSLLEESGGAGDREFRFAEITVATNNFAVMLSDDADSGTKVYKGKLHNGTEVAVMRLNTGRQGADDAVFAEHHILSTLRHDHIILGRCTEDGERMLVTQYMPNGSLYDHTSTPISHCQSMLLDPCGTPMLLPLDFLKSITHEFSDEQELGRGGFGVVYKGVIGNGKTIAVKKLHDIYPDDKDQFYIEVISLAGCRHKNVVQLMGYCDESNDELVKMSEGNYVKAEKRHRLICFEYLSNKSLDNYISDESSGFEWHIRYEIIKGICCGLHYLHKECKIVHLDLKPQNILMDDNMAPKIADFGMSRLFGEQQSRIITKNCGGTLGYMALEYLMNGLISTKSDIFSLGVIIIELLIGSRNYPQSYEAPFEHFIENVVRRWRNKLEKTWKDEHLEIYCRQVKACIEIGMKCVDPDPKKRPTAWDVIEILNAT